LKNNISVIMKRNFLSGLLMTEKIIDVCPDDLWVSVNGQFPFWQQIYHTLECVDYWFREEYHRIYDDAPKVWSTEKNVTPELDENKTEFNDFLCKSELKEYLNCLYQKTDMFFDKLNDTNIVLPIAEVNSEFTYLDVINMQIRHTMYHVGHCICILRSCANLEVEWISHNEK